VCPSPGGSQLRVVFGRQIEQALQSNRGRGGRRSVVRAGNCAHEYRHDNEQRTRPASALAIFHVLPLLRSRRGGNVPSPFIDLSDFAAADKNASGVWWPGRFVPPPTPARYSRHSPKQNNGDAATG